MDGIGWAASAMVAARARLDVASENLANVSSGAFVPLRARAVLTPGGVAVFRERVGLHGALERTGRPFDLGIVGAGSFTVGAPGGSATQTRDGRFVRERDGTLRDPRGRMLLAAGGAPLRVPEDARFAEDGTVSTPQGRTVARIALPHGSSLHAGFLESGGVDAIAQMIDVLAAERGFESAQKVVTAIDGTREKSASDVARIR
ncbi:MAG TPA: flagellar basal body rod C-terminal domain-containing protein [Candidatus Acidoferrales bacterium]|nr:flagellar basal body rod C-terminal domain-containing protein [Candidatus Acidoferrales bacterium]